MQAVRDAVSEEEGRQRVQATGAKTAPVWPALSASHSTTTCEVQQAVVELQAQAQKRNHQALTQLQNHAPLGRARNHSEAV